MQPEMCAVEICEIESVEELESLHYLSGFDPEFRQYSPGTILVAHAITEAIREGAREFYFLRGREDYKYKWGAVDKIIYRKRFTTRAIQKFAAV